MTQRQPQRRGLGRGLGALIPTAPVEEPETEVAGAPEASSKSSTSLGGATSYHGGTGTALDDAPGTDGVSPGSDLPDVGADGLSANGTAGLSANGTDGSSAGHAVGGVDGAVAGAYFVEVPVAQISPNPRQPREVFEEEAMAELVHSIREIGLLQPIVVRELGTDEYELVMGERRWRAAQEAGLEAIPAIVRQTGDNDMLRDALLENLHRSQLNPLEEAHAYEQMLGDFGCTHEELARRIGRSRPQISNTLRLLKLSSPVQRRVAAGVLSAGHARSLLAVEDGDLQDRLAQRVVSEGISVRGLEEIVAVGDGNGAKPRTQRHRPTAPGLDELAERLSDRFETRVKVVLGKSKGRISVEFASMNDLQRIVDVMDPRNRYDRPI